MSIEKDPASAAMAAELQAHINRGLRELAEYAGVLCSGCELSPAVVVRVVGNGRARYCQGMVSPIRPDVLTPAEYEAREAARQAEASFSYSGGRCPVYQSVGDGYIMPKEG